MWACEGMPIVLRRIDERLIHGQVVVGWGAALHPDRIVVVDDGLAAEGWEQELYSMGLPREMRTEFVSIDAARDRLDEWRTDPLRTILLTRDVHTMLSLAAGRRLAGEEVNLGGIHHAPGREEVLPYVFLSRAEADELRALRDEGALISARDLPSSREVGFDHLVGES
jgi:mannose/fructose/N-acetylgalactosamine-specific phosphotransferase system component IIB